MVKIIILNPIYAKCISGIELIKPILSFPTTLWRQGQYRKEKKVVSSYVISAKGFFYTGLVYKIEEFCKANKIEIEISKSKEQEEIEKETKPSKYNLPGIELREDQKRLVERALKYQRGILISGTGTGKSLIAFSILGAFNKYNCLFIVPNLSLLKQMEQDALSFDFENICILGDGKKKINSKITIATMQTLSRINLKEFSMYWDCILLDEAHLAIKKKSSIENIMKQLIAPIRIGLTATPPVTDEQSLVLEGLFGPILDEVTQSEAQEIGMLSKPYLSLVAVPEFDDYDYRSYKSLYEYAIIENQQRNNIVINEAKKLKKQNKSFLIFVKELKHGENIVKIAIDKNLDIRYVHGGVDAEERNKIRNLLEEKKIDGVIATIAWGVGINIKSLDCIIYACGGKSEIEVLQKIGRGMRKTEDKNEFLIIDFVDRCKYLSEHFCQRLCIYLDMGVKLR